MRNTIIFSLLGCLLFSGVAIAKEVSGTVTDKESGEPIYGAAVYVKGTTIGVMTDEKGAWKLADVPHEDFILIFEMPGYKKVEIESSGGVVHARLEVSMFNVGEVVITGTQTKYLYEDAPVKTEVVPKKQIEAVEEADLFGVLQYTPGLRVENNCQNCSFTQLRMLGLEGGYSQILINGDPVVSTMAGVYGLQQFPEQMIDTLEVVKGGGSALYGANAIGGVVNIRLRRPSMNTSAVSFNYKTAGSHVRSETGFYSEMVTDDNKYGMFIFGNARSNNSYDDDDDGYTEIGKLDGETIGMNMFYKVSNNSEVTGNLHRIHETRRGGNMLDQPYHLTDITEAAETYRWGGNVKYSQIVDSKFSYEAGYSFALSERETYYGAGQDPNAYGSTDNPVHYLSSMAHYSILNHNLTGGVSYTAEELVDKALSYNRVIDDDYNDFGLFLQDDISFLDRYTIVAGVRMDKHSLLDDPVISPRLSGLIKLTDEWKLRANVSTGFKPPQVFDEDLHITQVNGEGQVIENADDLTEENSLSFSGTIDYMGFVAERFMQFGVTGFHIILDDQFQIIEADDPTTAAYEFVRRNGDGLTVSGVELQAGVQALKNLELQGSLTLQTEELDSPEPDFGSTRLFRTPEQYGSLSAYYNPMDRLSVFAGINYTGEMKAPHYAGYIATDKLETTDAFTVLDLGLTYELFHRNHGRNCTKLKLGVKNITNAYQDDFDKGADRDAGYVYGPANPRMYYAGIEIGL